MNIDWKELGFGLTETNYNVRCYYKNGKWGELEISSSNQISMHMAATCLHYGQEAFEGLKAFRGKDDKIRLFRMDENAKRLIRSANGIMMEPVPQEIFEAAVLKVVELNKEFVPPYGLGASLYLRPLLIGTGAQVGVKPADEYLFMIFATPVGPYFKEGFNPVNIQISRDFDRTAPKGTGQYKVGGNYAASLQAGSRAKEEGYNTILFLDSKEQKYIDECGPANFFGIKNKSYITPHSPTILASITNMSLRVIAKDLGLKVEQRNIAIDELKTFEEAGACGTAAVISPIGKIQDRETKEEYVISKDGKPGKYTTQLYEQLLGIQNGDVEDKYGWNTIVE